MLIVTMNQVVIVVVVVVVMKEVVILVHQHRLHLHLIQIIQSHQQHKDMRHLHHHHHNKHIKQNVNLVHSMLNVLMNVVLVKMVGEVMVANVIIIVNLVIIGIGIVVFQRVMKRKMKVSLLKFFIRFSSHISYIHVFSPKILLRSFEFPYCHFPSQISYSFFHNLV